MQWGREEGEKKNKRKTHTSSLLSRKASCLCFSHKLSSHHSILFSFPSNGSHTTAIIPVIPTRFTHVWGSDQSVRYLVHRCITAKMFSVPFSMPAPQALLPLFPLLTTTEYRTHFWRTTYSYNAISPKGSQLTSSILHQTQVEFFHHLHSSCITLYF